MFLFQIKILFFWTFNSENPDENMKQQNCFYIYNNQHIRIKRSCYNEDWSNDAENSALE